MQDSLKNIGHGLRMVRPQFATSRTAVAFTYLGLIFGVKIVLLAVFLGVSRFIPLGHAQTGVMLVADVLFVGSAASALSATFKSYRRTLCVLFIVLFGLYACMASSVVGMLAIAAYFNLMK